MTSKVSKALAGLALGDAIPCATHEAGFQGTPRLGPRFVLQKQDHFDEANEHRWHQAYYVNDTFWVPGSKSPVFLCVGGEGAPIDGSAVANSVHCNDAVEWLPETGALMFALEHRYYGCHNRSACPVDSFDGPRALKYLSSKQAVEDIAEFVRSMNFNFGLGESNRWVTWGGSLPGMLAGWSRLHHPELIHAAVASSAPVRVVLDMHEYNDHVSYAFTVADNHVGGSVECRDAIRKGHAIVEGLFATAQGIAEVERRFQLPNASLVSLDARRSFAGYGVANFDAQDNDPACNSPACDISRICNIMLNASFGDELQRLVALRAEQGLAGQTTTGADAFSKQRAVPWGIEDPSVDDFWYYQTCTEFGGYMTCHKGSNCMYVQGLVDVESEAAACSRNYDLSTSDLARNFAAMNEHYGGATPAGSCVLWTNGEVDPFTSMGVYQAMDPRQAVLLVPGASHHSWTHPSRPGLDQESIVAARMKIRSQVQKFLSMDCHQPRAASVVAAFV